jgi:hypothetical protein
MLDNARLVPELLQLVAHVSTMRVVLRRWDRGDYAAASAITYPDKLLGGCEAEFNRQGGVFFAPAACWRCRKQPWAAFGLGAGFVRRPAGVRWEVVRQQSRPV